MMVLRVEDVVTAAIDPHNMVWIAVALVLMVAAALLAFFLVRRFFAVGRRGSKPAGPAFTLDQLDEMQRQGQLSEAEFKLLRDRILNQTRFGEAPAKD